MNCFEAEAPSNIALIKYMGKRHGQPANSSLSMTLSHLRTCVRVSAMPRLNGVVSRWQPLVGRAGWLAPELSDSGQKRFLRHAEKVLAHFERQEPVLIESANNFASDCGLASSASSFAALTLAIAKYVGRDTENMSERSVLADLSRQGSGSSCRSFFTPWSLWTADGVSAQEGLPSKSQIRHLVFVVDDRIKQVSSSEAHERVNTSLLYRGRTERVEERLRHLLDHLHRAAGADVDAVKAWNQAANLVWAESFEMHALFETSDPPFGYFVPGSVAVLGAIRDVTFERRQRGLSFREPMVTMDAGPNVHVLFWHDEDELVQAVVERIRMRLGETVSFIDSKVYSL